MADNGNSGKHDSAISLSDEELVKLIIESRNTKIYGILYDRYSQKVYSRCLKFVSQVEEAQDLTHDLFIKVFYNLSKFQNKSSFSTWLYAVTYNHCLDYLNKKNKLPLENEERLLDSTPDSSIEEIEDSEIFALKAEKLKIAMERVDSKDRMILLMKYLDDSSIKDIATVLQLSESAVKMRINRAKRRILDVYNDL
ncbi:RNA polymerase sigma factor [Algoriphagus zhangzhouensis]|uniref:RNA polymerase sigma-70 factor, ECF subfamily n=1 Tax=Algoriphagus zhangzhouensis TaxID=1073327 RepID=A0A1M7ZBT6_9BACT|nr:sigma-70 family RNA polymerase sigma factor [Algoriphagus zhangzhouensis]TDY46762.1 RNA polymerase sigma-70 factor (ECF subfamily) [Algoriphagus zhangzhouensis]SHO62279.1 RNA polymerase sigma-70 factor, ECF subfamily [Algoriphagus zhangzhouensis]